MKNDDLFTKEIIKNALQSIADEMFVAMRNTAMSPIIYEVLDMGTGVTDGKGNLASSGSGIPALIGVLDRAVKKIIELHPGDGEIEPGDVFITNDPYTGGVTHLNDAVIAMPVFFEGEIISWTANSAHWNDVGGSTPGSISTESTEIFQEGLQLPAVKLISRGEIVKPVFQIMRANTRLPDFMEGDMWAGIAAVRNGAESLVKLAGKYGRALFQVSLDEFMDEAEKISLAALKKSQHGTFTLSEPQDNGGIYNVAITINESQCIVDLRDNPEQDKGPCNLSADGAAIAAQMVFKSLTDHGGLLNGGTFRPLTLLTKPGTVFDAQRPAAQGFYYENLIRLHDLLLRCLAPHFKEIIPAGSFASVCSTVITGKNPDTGKSFILTEPQIGGWGAGPGRDGNHAIFSGLHGETYNCPVEVSESRYGVYIDRLELNDEAGGDGEFIGGRGIRLDYRIRTDNTLLQCGFSRSKVAPWGVDGGANGTTNYILVYRKNGETERHSLVSDLRVNEGDVVSVRTGCGGGYGDPKKRSEANRKLDAKNGFKLNA
jgi:N-methylhydantoinase B